MDTITAYKAKTKSGKTVYIPEVTKVASNILNNEEQIDLVDSSIQTSLKSLENRLNTAELDSASISAIQEAIDAIQELAYAAKVETDFNAMQIDIESPEMTAYIDSLTGVVDPGGELDDYLTANVETFPEEIDELNAEVDELLAQLDTESNNTDLSEEDQNETFGTKKSLTREGESSDQTFNSAKEAFEAVKEYIDNRRTEPVNKAKEAANSVKEKIKNYKTEIKNGKTFGYRFKKLLKDLEKNLQDYLGIMQKCSALPDDEKPLKGDKDPKKNQCCKAEEDAEKEVVKIKEFEKSIPTNDDKNLKAAFDCGFACGFDDSQKEPDFSGIQETAKRINYALDKISKFFDRQSARAKDQYIFLKNASGPIKLTCSDGTVKNFSSGEYFACLRAWVASYKAGINDSINRFNTTVDQIVSEILLRLPKLFTSTCDATSAENKVIAIYNSIIVLHTDCHTDGITLIFHLNPPCEEEDITKSVRASGSQIKDNMISYPNIFSRRNIKDAPEGISESEERYNKWGYWKVPESTDDKTIDIYGEWQNGRWYQCKIDGIEQDKIFLGYVFTDEYWPPAMEEDIKNTIRNKKLRNLQFLGREDKNDNPHPYNMLAFLSFQTPKIKVTHVMPDGTESSATYSVGDTIVPWSGAKVNGSMASQTIGTNILYTAYDKNYAEEITLEDIGTLDEMPERKIQVEKTITLDFIHENTIYKDSMGETSNPVNNQVYSVTVNASNFDRSKIIQNAYDAFYAISNPPEGYTLDMSLWDEITSGVTNAISNEEANGKINCNIIYVADTDDATIIGLTPNIANFKAEGGYIAKTICKEEAKEFDIYKDITIPLTPTKNITFHYENVPIKFVFGNTIFKFANYSSTVSLDEEIKLSDIYEDLTMPSERTSSKVVTKVEIIFDPSLANYFISNKDVYSNIEFIKDIYKTKTFYKLKFTVESAKNVKVTCPYADENPPSGAYGNYVGADSRGTPQYQLVCDYIPEYEADGTTKLRYTKCKYGLDIYDEQFLGCGQCDLAGNCTKHIKS